jgi:MFS family permease
VSSDALRPGAPEQSGEGRVSGPSALVSRAYIAAFTAAQVGAYVSFIPLLAILLPLKAQAIGGVDKAQVLSVVAFWGSLIAALANPIAGMISDRTSGRWGRRRPWILAGSVGTVAAYTVIGAAHTAGVLLLGFILFQLFFNFMFSPLNALVPDRIPDRQKGSVSGLIGLGLPVGGAIGALIIGQWIQDETGRYAAIAVILLVSVVPFAIFMKEHPLSAEERPLVAFKSMLRSLWVSPRRHPDFAWAWLARFLVLVAYTLVTNYMLFYLQDAVHYSTLYPGRRVEAGLATLTAIGSVGSVLSTVVGGYLSDRFGRRKPFVIGAALLMVIATAIFALLPTWPGMVLGYAIFGLGMGCFFAVDIALIAQVLPAEKDAGKDLGIMNLTNTFAQTLAPLLAVQVLVLTHNHYELLFGIAAIIGLLGAVAVQPVRSVR